MFWLLNNKKDLGTTLYIFESVQILSHPVEKITLQNADIVNAAFNKQVKKVETREILKKIDLLNFRNFPKLPVVGEWWSLFRVCFEVSWSVFLACFPDFQFKVFFVKVRLVLRNINLPLLFMALNRSDPGLSTRVLIHHAVLTRSWWSFRLSSWKA